MRDGEESSLLAHGTNLGFVRSLTNGGRGIGDGGEVLGRAGFVPQEKSDALELFGTVSVGKKAVVANPHEATGKHVEKEPAKELEGVEAHGSLNVLIGVVLVAESDLAVVEGDQPLIGDGDAMGVSGEVLEHLLGTAERGLGVNHPVFISKGLEPTFPCLGMFEFAKVAVETKLLVLPGSLKSGEKLSPEEPAQESNGQKEPLSAVHPALFIKAQASAGNDAMEMRMVMEGLSPGVQNGETGDLRPEMFRVSAEGQQGLRNGAKEHPVDDAAILKRERRELLRNGEHHVEVLHIEQFLLTRLEPVGSSRPLTLRTMPIAARVVNRHLVTAAVLFEMTS